MTEDTTRIAVLEIEIEQHKYYLSDGRMSNPMKIKRRKRDLKNAQAELLELKNHPISPSRGIKNN